MGLLNQYLQIKNRIKFNDAVMDGIAKAISNGVEQHVSKQLHINQNGNNSDNNRLLNSTVIDAEVQHENINDQTKPMQKDNSDKTPTKKSFKELKESVKVYSNGDNKGIYDLNLGKVSAEPNNPKYIRVRKCITSILLHYLEEGSESKLREQLFIDRNDERFTAVLYLTLYFLIRASIIVTDSLICPKTAIKFCP